MSHHMQGLLLFKPMKDGFKAGIINRPLLFPQTVSWYNVRGSLYLESIHSVISVSTLGTKVPPFRCAHHIPV